MSEEGHLGAPADAAGLLAWAQVGFGRMVAVAPPFIRWPQNTVDICYDIRWNLYF